MNVTQNIRNEFAQGKKICDKEANMLQSKRVRFLRNLPLPFMLRLRYLSPRSMRYIYVTARALQLCVVGVVCGAKVAVMLAAKEMMELARASAGKPSEDVPKQLH